MRYKHQLSHYRLLTGDLGQLLPCGLVEVLPGDMFRHSASVLARLSPMQAPVMHPMRVRLHHYFVPHRLSWPDDYPTTWENFITGGPSNNEANPLPSMQTTGTANDLMDYLGLPTTAAITVSSLPVRAFNLVFNEWYRDQDLVTERTEEDVTVPLVAWEKDYYTTARPWAQKGPEITVPLGTSAPVRGIGKGDGTGYTNSGTYRETGGVSAAYAASNPTDEAAPSGFAVEEDPTNPGYPNIWADLSEAAAAKVNDIRRAFALARFAEARAAFGSRYAEYLRYLGVRPSDARLQRPEFLGGSTQSVSVSEVLQTAPDDSTDPRYGVSDMYGHGIASGRGNAYRRRFNEHGYVISLLSVRPKQMFSEGIERHYLYRDREDFWQQELQFIGQQQVLEQEIYADGTNKDAVFGYSDRYDQYRNQRSLVTGEFRTTLDYWHLARKFASAPVLNASFIECDPSKRIFSEQTQHSLWMAVNHRLVARRLVSRNAPGRIM